MNVGRATFGTTAWRTTSVLALFALLTTLHTWPLVPRLSTQISTSPDVPVNV